MTQDPATTPIPPRKLPYEDARILRCPAMPWNADTSVCRGCNTPLSGRQQRWCSEPCSDWYGRNHFWTNARWARLEIDDFTCQRCGTEGFVTPPDWLYFRRHGWKPSLKRKEAIRLNDLPPLEVNHVWPLAHQEVERYGYKLRRKHADSGCHHHLSLLMTLCRPCHRRITNQQFGLKQPVIGKAPLPPMQEVFAV